MDSEDIRLLQMTPTGRQALARRLAQEAAETPATFATTPHLAAANRGRRDGVQAGTLHYHMGRPEMPEDIALLLARGAHQTNEGATSDAERSAYVNAYAAAHRAAYRAARATGKPQGPDGDPESRRKLLSATPAGRHALARESNQR